MSGFWFYAQHIGHVTGFAAPTFGSLHPDMDIIWCTAVRSAHLVNQIETSVFNHTRPPIACFGTLLPAAAHQQCIYEV